MHASSKWLILAALVLIALVWAPSQLVLARVDAPTGPQEASPLAPDAPLLLNHFYCYQIQGSKPVSETVKLQDQFNKRARRANVGETVRLCNPVQKTHNDKVTKILYPNDHLLMYNIGQHTGEPKRLVQVRNQFGSQELAVFFPAEVLAVPTKKGQHANPQNTDHFKCYAVQGQPLQVPVFLEDQFQKTSTVVLQPFGLCNPTRKYHKGKWTEVKNKDAHLVCYRVQSLEFSKTVRTVNQFRREKVTTVAADMLCVPSRKKIIQS